MTHSAAECSTSLGRAPALPPLCRPCGWIAAWRRIGAFSVLDGQGRA